MKVLHGPQNISGMAFVLAKLQRQLGVEAESVTHWHPVYKFRSDRWLDAAGVSPNPVDPATFFRDELFDYDVYHFYFGQSYTGPDLSELPKLKAKGKKIFMYFCGCDVRDSKKTLQTYRYSVCQDCWPQACSPNRDIALAACEKYADGVFVSTVDLLDVLPQATWLPQPVSSSRLKEAVKSIRRRKLGRVYSRRSPFTIAHAPSDPLKKGTSHIEKAVEAMVADGLHVKLEVMSGVTHTKAIRTCAQADLAIDQIIAGVYGSFAVEMMAVRVPVVAFLREDWMDRFPKVPPIINANPNSIEQVLRDAYDNVYDFGQLADNGEKFVLEFHEANKVAAQAVAAYRGLK